MGIATFFALLPLLASGCGERSRGEGWAGVVDTLPTGVVHVRNPRAGVWAADRGWSAVPDLRIGTVASGGPQEFARVADIAVDDGGRLFVVDQVARQIRVFGRDGSSIRTFGTHGPGPGELENPKALDRGSRGRLWIADSGNWRFQLYDTAGTAAGTHPFAPQMYTHGDRWGDDGLLYTFVAERGRASVPRVVRVRLER